MKFVTVLSLCLMIAAGTALAGLPAEKQIDTQNALPQATSRAALSGTLGQDSDTYNRIYGGDLSLNCASDVDDSSNDGQFFALFCISVTDSEPIELIVDPALTNIADTVMTIYCDPFDVADPSANVVSYDDDGGDNYLSAFVIGDGITLDPANNYYVVLSTFSAGAVGEFSITTSANVIECGVVANEASSWDSLKANYR